MVLLRVMHTSSIKFMILNAMLVLMQGIATKLALCTANSLSLALLKFMKAPRSSIHSTGVLLAQYIKFFEN